MLRCLPEFRLRRCLHVRRFSQAACRGTTQLAYAHVVSAWFDEQRGRALAEVMAGSGLGSMVFPAAAEFLISAYGWRAAYAVLGFSDQGATIAQTAAVLSTAGLAALVSKLSTGYLLDRFRAGRVTALLLAACGFGFLIILLGYSASLAIASAILVGAGMGAKSDAVPYLLTRYFGLARFG